MKIVTAKYLPFGIPERPSDPARFVLDASNAASITLGTRRDLWTAHLKGKWGVS